MSSTIQTGPGTLGPVFSFRPGATREGCFRNKEVTWPETLERNPVAHTLVDLINRTYVEQHPERDKPFRNHLGGSQIGRKCDRELYYIFRWFRRPTFDGRMLRLFDRGHKEEFSFLSLLASAGIEVLPYSERLMYHPESDSYVTIPARFSNQPPTDPETETLCLDVTGDTYHHTRAKNLRGVEVKQWRISDCLGHFGGSLDGIGQATVPIEIWEFFEGRAAEYTGRLIPPGEEFLTEFKTHNTKSFVNMVNGGGVKVAKPEHYTQMQTYMRKRGLKFGLYVAVNKNDDDLHIEIVELVPEIGDKAVARAERIIQTTFVPERIGKHPSWHECKFCDFKQICHYGDDKEIDRNCRTCKHSSPVAEGRWHCGKWQMPIPVDAVLKGCDAHLLIRD